MKISKEEVIHVANLARLKVDDASIDKFADQVGKILEYVDTLESVNTEGVEPTSHAAFLTNVFREDEVKESIGVEAGLSNAPEKEDGCFIVPKVIG